MKIGEKLIVGVIVDEDEENRETQIEDIDLQYRFDKQAVVIYSDMEDVLNNNSGGEMIVVLEVVDFGHVSTNPKFKSEKPEPKIKKSK